jgi:hypothetical protein
MRYDKIPPKPRRYVLGLMNLATEFEEPEDQAQVVLRARLIAMLATKKPAPPRPRRRA